MAARQEYAINSDVKFGALEVVDVAGVREQVRDPWFNQTLCRVNDSVVRLGVVQGEFHWHRHENEDEFFYVLDGRLIVDVEGRPSVELNADQGYIVPKGLTHRTRAPVRTSMLMMALAGVEPTGD